MRFLTISIWVLLTSLGCVVLFESSKKKEKPFRVMFYNVENLFDTDDDAEIDDEEYLPQGELQWDKEKMQTKLNHIAQVMEALGAGSLPDIVGFAEIENRKVLDLLLQNTELKKSDYSIVHFDSPDKRGIDVGLLYRKERFTFIKCGKYPVAIPGDTGKPTRDILYVKGLLPNKSSLHILVNHWPSRSGGAAESEHKRIAAAKTAKRLCDSIQFNEKNANILLMGDFNDYPTNQSLKEVLQAAIDTTLGSAALYNLMGWQKGEGVGSHTYKGEWGFLDQIIASDALVKGNSGAKVFFKDAQVFKADFLMEKNEKYGVMEPRRTYGGKKYLGGYSDHLPVFVDVRMLAPTNK
ncbi:MAG: endonuclease/exonuclease/phosphatase family protein [Bacteroidia bacterium]|jgi:predicted extracellular nuclease